ncbi:LytR/AlgR family response regulator transcription factor [Diplocloster agilis]|uniref:Stage 0 sporulation protein A homolog n=1 Tax=Diplocloster agilis TaxID=2850323 RepID=A0A949N9T8_9FIRM|nr:MULTISPECIES: LytTR family DNA-binding domain-containing protein [Lachnospiraceae]MBU9735737.1 LytTR family DNA-binding domain-containing protein [Diplocloster agilis]MCU6732475.1 LytTR family DNA-binding domain-containing protein [Suonthocola fibrivorans]SCI48218.1 Sensory transduction protein lytR [uncultured Clostridium sp.]
MINIAIVDDDNSYLERLKEISEKYFSSYFMEFKLSTYSKGCNLAYELEDGKRFHVYLLDIELSDGGMNGLELAKVINTHKNWDSYVIFITNHSEYALYGYELDIFRYILKDQMEEKLPQALEEIGKRMNIQNGEFFIIDKAGCREKVFYRKILYIYKEKKNAVFITDYGISTVRSSLNSVMDRLNNDGFIFINKGIIINISRIQRIKGLEIMLDNGERLYASRTHIQDVKVLVAEFWRKYM